MRGYTAAEQSNIHHAGIYRCRLVCVFMRVCVGVVEKEGEQLREKPAQRAHVWLNK